MERIKQMSLKKSLFALVFIFLLGGLLLAFLSYQLCVNVIDNNGYYHITYATEELAANQVSIQHPQYEIWSFLQYFLPVVCIIVSLVLSNIVFYNIKLKKPIAILQSSAERIRQQNLNFTVKKVFNDELGELATAFDSMREELYKNNQELWRQMEERKRLNAAFAHDLRNPVTVLKGSAKMLDSQLKQGGLTIENAVETISLITQYTGRIESYIEAMTGAQKLEAVKFEPKPIYWSELTAELKSSLSIIGTEMDKKISFYCDGENRQINIDGSIIHNTAENLVNNALRFAKNEVSISLLCDDKKITMIITDDGAGFSPAVLKQGAIPFLRGDDGDPSAHFGMGLYICRLQCEKHGGNLILENLDKGAKVTATFFF